MVHGPIAHHSNLLNINIVIFMYVHRRGVPVCGVLSCRRSINIENARKMAIPKDIFSPESTGITKVTADRAAKTTVGMMMFNR